MYENSVVPVPLERLKVKVNHQAELRQLYYSR